MKRGTFGWASSAATWTFVALLPAMVGRALAGQPALARGLRADYFNLDDRGANGQLPATEPTVSRVEPSIAFDWGVGSPSPRVRADFFGARWQGYFRADAPGKYVFRMDHTGLARVTIAGQLVYEAVRTPRRPALIEYSVTAKGWVPFTVEVIEGVGRARVRIDWSPPGSPNVVSMPSYTLAHRPP